MKINLESLRKEKGVSSLVASQAALGQVQLGEMLGCRADRASGLRGSDSPPPTPVFRCLGEGVPGSLEPDRGEEGAPGMGLTRRLCLPAPPSLSVRVRKPSCLLVGGWPYGEGLSLRLSWRTNVRSQSIVS